MQQQAWFVPVSGRVPRGRLFCFPSAGKGIAGYASWRHLLPEAVEVLPARLPGRDGRFREAPITRFPDLLEQLAEHIEPFLDVPFAFFGHSLGALVAFEMARLLREQRKPLPFLLMVAARSAPHLRTTTPISHLPPDQFLGAIQDRYGAFDEEIRHNQEILNQFEPILRADFTLFDNYVYCERPPLECPIRAYGGSRDTMTLPPDLEAWDRHTVAGFSFRSFDGHHFFFEKDRKILVQFVDDIRSSLMKFAPG